MLCVSSSFLVARCILVSYMLLYMFSDNSGNTICYMRLSSFKSSPRTPIYLAPPISSFTHVMYRQSHRLLCRQRADWMRKVVGIAIVPVIWFLREKTVENKFSTSFFFMNIGSLLPVVLI